MSEIFAFGEFELDTACFELRRRGELLEAQPKVLRLLAYLIEHRARAVPGEELLRELWPEATVTQGSVKRAVLGVRHALGERGEESSRIRTVRGLGYRFVGELTVRQAAPGPAPAAAVSAVDERAGTLFVGRSGILEILLRRLDDAREGRGGAVLLTGAPGIGKTRTAEELWARARSRDAHVWIGRCRGLHGAPTLWPVQQLLRDALRDLGAPRLRALLGQGTSEVVRALPELRSILGDVPESAALSTRSERFRLFDSLGVFMRSVAEQRPLVLGFDDLQHADIPTLELLAFLSRQLTAARLLIVGTFRRDASTAPASHAALDELAREERVLSIELEGFERDDIARYVSATTGVELPEHAVRELRERTAGNPLFVRQLVDRMRSHGSGFSTSALTLDAGGADLHAAIERHLEVLSPDKRALLHAAALLGREFSCALLARTLGRAPSDVWQELAEAEASGVIEPSAEHGRFRFVHSLICDALYRQLSLAERARLHGAAGVAIEAQGIGADYVLLCEATRHFVEAAPVHDGGKALPYALRAAEDALSRLAYEEAAAHFACALKLQEYASPDPRARMSLMFRRAQALARTAQLAAARVALFDVLALAREHADVDLTCQAAALLVERPETGSVDPAQLAALRGALTLLAADDPRRLLLTAALAKSLSYGRDREERVRLAQEALAARDQVEDVRSRASLLSRCHEALLGPEHLQQRVSIAAELLQLAERSREPALVLRASATQIETCMERGDMDAVERAVGAMEALAEQVREPYFRWHAKAVRSTQAMIAGHVGLAERAAEEALHLGAPLGESLARHAYCTQVIGIYQLQGRTADAEPLAREMALRYPNISGWTARVGIMEHGLGRADAARRCLDSLMARQNDWLRDEPFALSGLCSIAELCTWVGDRSAAEVLYRELSPYADHIGLTHLGVASYGPVSRLLGVLAYIRGDVAASERHHASALATAEALPSPTYWAVTALSFADLLVALGGGMRRAQAAKLLAKATERAWRYELSAVAAFASDLQRRHGLQGMSHSLS